MKKFLCNVLMIVCIFSGMNVKEGYGQTCAPCTIIEAFEATCDPANASGDCSVAIGSSADASEFNSVAVGAASEASGSQSMSFGVSAEAAGIGSTAIHTHASALGNYSLAVGGTAMSIGAASYTFGSMIAATESSSFAFGKWVSSDAEEAFIMGLGTTITGFPLFSNDIERSMMFGMNSDVPTLFIGESGGTGTWGNIGIGNITAPASLLHVRDQMRVGLTDSADGSLLFNNTAGSTITFNTPTSLTTHSYTWPTAQATTSGQVLVNDGTGTLSWAAPGSASGSWLVDGNSGTNPSSNFLGTLDNVDLVLRTDDTERMRVMAGGNVGIGITDPQGRLHLYNTSGQTDLVIGKLNAFSGRLVFRDGATETANISLDSNEDLIIENDRNDRDIYFKTNDGGTDTEVMRIDGSTSNVGIGTAAPAAKLHVRAAPAGFEQFLRLTVNDAALPEADNFLRIINNTNDADELGFMIDAKNGNSADNPALTLNGIIGHTLDSDTIPVMTFNARGDSSGVTRTITTRPLFSWHNNGMRLMRMDATGNLGIGTTTPSGRLHVNGTVVINYASLLAGNPLGGGPPATDFMLGVNTGGQLLNMGASSAQFKENIEDINFDKEAFLNLRPVNFRWKEIHGGYNDVGLIAQEVNETFPALASWTYKHSYLDNGDFLRDSLGIPVVDTTQMEVGGVRYHKLPVYLLAIAKGQQQELDELRQEVQQLLDQVNSCCAEVQPMNRIGDSPDMNGQAKMDEFILLKNDPNPFSDHTDIHFEHDGCVKCEIIISDSSGRVLKRIKTIGSKGTVRVYSSEIGSGMFLYSLVKDGRTVLTERMVSSNH